MDEGLGAALSAFPLARPGTPLVEPTPRPTGTVDIQQNMGLWAGFFDKIRSDPNFAQSIMAAGAQMMQTQPGQGFFGGAGAGLSTGINTLQALRERDRIQGLQAQDRAERLRQQELENKNKERELSREDRSTSLYGEQVRSTTALGERKARHDEADDAEKNAIEREKVRTLATRADAYAEHQTQVPAKIQEINMLADHYVASEGMDVVEAKARATRELNTRSSSDPNSPIAFYKANLSQWASDPTNFGKEPPPDVLQKAIEQAQTARGAAAVAAGQAGPTVERAAAIPAAASPQKDPKVVQQVEILKKRGMPTATIAAAIKAKGLNPADYGVQ